MNRPLTSDLSRRRFLAGGALGGLAWLASQRKASSQAPAVWVDRRKYGPFQCMASFSLTPLEAVFEELAQLQIELTRTLATPPGDQTVDLYLLADQRGHRAFLGELYPGLPYRRALYVQRAGRGAVYAYRHPELAIDLRHECTHALLHASLPAVPLWLDEGLAEYFEMPPGERAFGHPHQRALRWHLRLGILRTVESLERLRDLAQMGSLEYRFSWAWVHFMLHGPAAAHRALVEHLAEIRRGQTRAVLSQRLRSAVPDLDRRLVQHFSNWARG
ncbi:MAG: hypothetical protein IT424_14205 [Pirellulales bacterium]|nr:hypothetical protein [Pirellulales bacterium]